MNLKPLSVQLYSLRERAEKDFYSVLKDVADMGYVGVEPAGFWNYTPAELKKVLDDLGLKIFSSHSPWCNPSTVDAAMEAANALGVKKIACGYGPDNFKDLDAIKKTADEVNAMVEKTSANGYELFIHNHYWEFDRIDGKPKHQILAELAPGLKFQIDSFWSTNKGKEDAVEMLKLFGDRVTLLHMKDGVCAQSAQLAGTVNGNLDMKIDLMPLGTGTLPIADIVKAAPDTVETIIVELDYCNVDMTEAIARSYEYMVGNKLAYGNK